MSNLYVVTCRNLCRNISNWCSSDCLLQTVHVFMNDQFRWSKNSDSSVIKRILSVILSQINYIANDCFIRVLCSAGPH